MHSAPIRFAILHHDAAFEHWQTRCLEELVALPGVHAHVLITAQEPATHLPCALAGVPRTRLPRSADPEAGPHDTHTAATQINSYDLDFILSFEEAPCPPAIVDVPRYGVWRFQFGDWTRYRGGPSGFWEVYDGESVSAAMLTRVRPESDSVIVLREGFFRTDLLSHARNRNKMRSRVVRWPAQICVDIRNGATERFSAKAVLGAARVRTTPTRAQLAKVRCKILARALGVALRSLFSHDQWNVGLVDQPIAAFLSPQRRPPVQWLPDTKREELRADPFGALHDGRLTILCEHFSYRDNLGFIVAIEPTGAPAGRHVAIGPQPPVHMSYPFLLEADQRMFCVPETSDAQEIGLYEAEQFPGRWKKIATLVTNKAIVDATLFHYGDHWWLAGSEVAPKGANCELHLWYAPKLMGPWCAHANNPVKVDIRSARPAGTPFLDNGVLYRPAQDCSTTYGARVIINRVLTLTPMAFREEAFAQVDPDPTGPYPNGLHTLSQVGNATLIDGKRARFVPAEFRRVLGKTLLSAFKRTRP